MGRLEDKYEEDDEDINFDVQPFEPPENIRQPEPQGVLTNLKKSFRKFGFSKNSYELASDIENDPSPEGALRITFSGRPLDIHMLEDYLVWRTSPLSIKTILRYGHAKTIEDIRGLLSGVDRAKGNPKMLIMIVLAIILMVGGIVFLLYGPNLASMFGG